MLGKRRPVGRLDTLPMKIEPVTMKGRHIRLEPLTLGHLPQLCEVGLEEDLWRWIPFPVRTPADMRIYIETALKLQTEGTALPFATLERASGSVIGSTRFGNIDTINHHVEIGWTWIGRNWQQTMVNTEAKYLMLRHAFEILGCLRVELKTDSLNHRSRNAILRIGAKEEGTFRNHMITASGRLRHTVYYSIINTEWPEIKTGLEAKLARRYP